MMKRKNTYRRLFQKPFFILPMILIFSFQFCCLNRSFAQEHLSYINARTILLNTLKKTTIDKSFSQSINHFYFTTCDSLIKKNVMIDNKPIRSILTRLFDASVNKFNNKSIAILRIPSLNHYFLQTIKVYKKQPLKILYREIGIIQTGILETAFEGLPLGDSISTFSGLREMLNTPYYISTRLQLPRYAPYKDTLLYFLSNAEPEILVNKINDHDSLFTALVKQSNNTTVKAVTQIKSDAYFNQVIPFSLAILQNRITVDQIKLLTLKPQEYYCSFIEEAIRLHTSPEPETRAFLAQQIADLNKSLASQYYINEINMLHESPDKIRFQILQTLSARELYFLLVGGSGELYTSSFLYVYKKFLKEAEIEGLDEFFKNIDYYQFTQFISNISGYGLVSDLVNHMQEEKFALLIGSYFRTLKSTQLTDNQIILNAMTLSDVLFETRQHSTIRTNLSAQLGDLENPAGANDIMLQRLYRGLKDILQDKDKNNSDSTYDILPVIRLLKQQCIVQAQFYYDDDDACMSFNNSTATYDTKMWEKTDRGNYIFFQSRHGNNMRIYMNKPMTDAGCDAAQDEMLSAIGLDGFEVTSIIHRGHSYYLFQSLKKIPSSCQLVFLGSCGGYNEVLDVFELNPDMNIIATRNIGSTLINDPLLYRINTDIVNNKDIVWDNLWQEFTAKLPSKTTRDLFSSYIAPNKYIGVQFIRKVFNF